jgi:hypothetical protein
VLTWTTVPRSASSSCRGSCVDPRPRLAGTGCGNRCEPLKRLPRAEDDNAVGLRSTTADLSANRSSRVQTRPWRPATVERILAKVEVARSKPVSRSTSILPRPQSHFRADELRDEVRPSVRVRALGLKAGEGQNNQHIRTPSSEADRSHLTEEGREARPPRGSATSPAHWTGGLEPAL